MRVVCLLLPTAYLDQRGTTLPQDNLCTKDLQTTAGSKQLRGYMPPYDATAVARLRAAGAVLVGKTNMDEVRFRGPHPWAADVPPAMQDCTLLSDS